MNGMVRILTHTAVIALIVSILQGSERRIKRRVRRAILGTFGNFWEKTREKNVQKTAKNSKKIK